MKKIIHVFTFSILLNFIGKKTFPSCMVNADTSVIKYYFKKSDYIDSLSFYIKNFGINKKVTVNDSDLMLAFFVALRHYPELNNIPVEIQFKDISATMQAQPMPTFIFKSHKNRAYKMIINKNKSKNGMTYSELSFNALVGWIGHELAHLIDYSKRSNGSLIYFIFEYLFSDEFERNTERNTDIQTIQHGLGYPLYEGVVYLLNNSNVNEKYKEKTKKYYLSPEEILKEIKN